MMYAYIDGDDIGLRIENSFMSNNEKNLKLVNDTVKGIINDITGYLEEKGSEIIFSGADGIICKSEYINGKDIIDFIRGKNEGISFSIGIGMGLREAFLALRYAKSSGKDIIAVFDREFTLIK